MVSFAQALVVVRGNKQRPVATVRRLVVYPGSTDAEPKLCALRAPRSPEELLSPELLPQRQVVHPVPLGALTSCRFLRLMLRAISVPSQFLASRMPTWPERFLSHGLSPPGKTKSAQATAPNLGTHWLRRWSLHDTGSGSRRYSRCFLLRTSGSIPAGLGLWCLARASGLSPCHNEGTSTIRSSRLFYQFFLEIAMISSPLYRSYT